MHTYYIGAVHVIHDIVHCMGIHYDNSYLAAAFHGMGMRLWLYCVLWGLWELL